MDKDCDHDWRDKDWDIDLYMSPHDRVKNKDANPVDPDKYKTKDALARILMHVEGMENMVCELKGKFFQINQTVVSHSSSIKQLEIQIGQISTQLNTRQKAGFPSNLIVNQKNDSQVLDMSLGVVKHSVILWWMQPNLKKKFMNDSNEESQKFQEENKKNWC